MSDDDSDNNSSNNKRQDDQQNMQQIILLPINKVTVNRKRPLWANGLTISEYKKYNKEYQKLKNHINKPIITIPDIIKSNLLFSEKCEMLEKKEAFDRLLPGGFEYISIKKRFKKDVCELFKARKEKQKNREEILNRYRDDFSKKLYIGNYEQSLEEQILFSNKREEDKLIIYEKFLQLSPMKDTSADEKILKWINLSLRIPTKTKNNILSINMGADAISIFKTLHDIRSKLDSEIYAMNKAKDRIIELLYNKINNPRTKGNILAIVGKPGIGKTFIMEKLANILDLPLEKISMGGVNDSEFLTGTRQLYVGSEPGAITKALIKMKCTNGILFLDEFDKIPQRLRRESSDIQSTLLPILDAGQNERWDGDQYFAPLKINLSNLWFILSMNDETKLPDMLKDRIDILHMDGYCISEKIELTEKYLLKEVYENVNQNPENFIFEKNSLNRVIVSLGNNERSGVRYIKHFLNSLISKLGLLRLHVIHKYNKKRTRKQRKIEELANYLSDQQKKIIDIIIQDTNVNLLNSEIIYISHNTLMKLKDIIYTTATKNDSLMRMYL